jgi:hypothetical protein
MGSRPDRCRGQSLARIGRRARSLSVPFSAVYGALEADNEAETAENRDPRDPLQYSFLDHCAEASTAQAPKSDAKRHLPLPLGGSAEGAPFPWPVPRAAAPGACRCARRSPKAAGRRSRRSADSAPSRAVRLPSGARRNTKPRHRAPGCPAARNRRTPALRKPRSAGFPADLRPRLVHPSSCPERRGVRIFVIAPRPTAVSHRRDPGPRVRLAWGTGARGGAGFGTDAGSSFASAASAAQGAGRGGSDPRRARPGLPARLRRVLRRSDRSSAYRPEIIPLERLFAAWHRIMEKVPSLTPFAGAATASSCP